MIYTDENRGKIHNPALAKQIIDFSGIRYGLITPTDIDGFFEYHDEAFVFYEMKRRGVRMPRGQEVAFCRLVDALTSAGKYAALFKCVHDVEDPEQHIQAAETEVETVYMCGVFRPGHGMTAREATDVFMEWAQRMQARRGLRPAM